MNRTTHAAMAIALVAIFTSPPLLADETEGALSRSIRSEAARLAAEATEKDDAAWQRVRSLPAGTKIVVSVRGAASRQWRFVSADGAQLTGETSDGMPESLARADVLEVKTAPMGWESHNKQLFAVIGGVAGAAAGYALAYDYARGNKGVYRAQLGFWPGLGAG